MQAYVGVQLTMPDGQGTLQLAEEHAPLLQVLSGPASRLEGRSERWVDHHFTHQLTHVETFSMTAGHSQRRSSSSSQHNTDLSGSAMHIC
jgi:hypothetical protein